MCLTVISSMKIPDIPTSNHGKFISRWQCLVEAVRTFGDIAARVDDDGVDVRFVVRNDLDATGLKNGKDLLSILRNIEQPSKAGYLNDVLHRILFEYLTSFVRGPVKPLNVIIITDGVTGDHERVENTLVRVAKMLAAEQAPPGQVGVQFVQIGFDESATAWLVTLDDKLREMHGVRDVSSISSSQIH